MANAGLPSNTINALSQDHDGIVWAATDWGLCRFENDQWTVIQQQAGGLPENGLTSLAVDSANRLWVGTTLNGVAIHDNGTWSHYTIDNSALPDNSINGITHDHRGWVWISTTGGLACITDQGWRVYDNTPDSHMGFEFFGPHMNMVAVRPPDLVAIVTMNGGLNYLTETDHTYFTTYNSTFPDNSANAIAFDSNGDRWIASTVAGLIRHAGPYAENTWFNYTAQNSGFPDNTLTSLVIDAADTKYAGTEIGGVIVFPSNGIWYALNETNSGLPDDRVLCLMLDQDGVLWAGTHEGGIARWDPMSVTIGDPAEIPMPIVFPNPFSDRITIDLRGGFAGGSWMLIDATGKLVEQGAIGGEGSLQIRPSVTAPGMYTLRLQSTEGVSAIKLMKGL